MFDTQELLDGIKHWVLQETPTNEPARVDALSRSIEDTLHAAGLKTRRVAGRDGYGDHLVAETTFADPRPPILLMAHIDTVHPIGSLEDNPYRIEGDKAYGPGIYDMKGGAFIAFEIGRRLQAQPLSRPRNVVLVFTADEEVGSPTSEGLIRELAAKSGYALVVEPARDGGNLVTARKGVARYIATFTGRAAHSGGRYFDGRSAIREMARKIVEWEGYSNAESGLTLNVGIAKGGTAFNTIPDHAQAFVDIRLPTPDLAAATVARFEATTTHDSDIGLSLKGGLNRMPYAPNPMTDALFERARIIGANLGLDLKQVHAGGGSDGNFTAETIPTLDGLGVDGEGAHTKHEHLRISSLNERATLLYRLIEDLSAAD